MSYLVLMISNQLKKKSKQKLKLKWVYSVLGGKPLKKNKMKLEQYSKYKETGVDFLGKVPADWNVNRLKFLLSALQSGKRELEEEIPFENGAFSLGGEHINWNGTLKLDNVRLVSKEFYDT